MLKSNKGTSIYIILLYLLILQPYLQMKINLFQYFDELFSIVLLGLAILKLKTERKIKKVDILIITLLLIILVIGIISNILYQYQKSKYVISDILVFYKFFIVYFCFNFLFKGKIRRNGNWVYFHIKIIIIILGILTILNYIFKIFPSGGESYGIMINQLFFGHPTGLSSMCVFLIGNVFVFGKDKNSKYLLLFILYIIMASTLRMKALAFLAVAALMIIYIIKIKRKINTLKIIFAGVLCIIISFNQLKFYFIEDTNTARGALLTTSFKIANDYFPLGTGFGTFASHFSGVNYSPIYEKYNINTVWGLSVDKPSFISDSFWPMVLGQFGYIGLLIYALCIILIYWKIQHEYNTKNRETYIAKMLCLIYLLISSMAESSFVNPLSIPLAIIIGLEWNEDKNISISKKNNKNVN